MTRVEAVIFDWAGTTVDHGSLAPVIALTELFARHGIAISRSDARRDMGLFKKDHIRRILAMEQVAQEWRARNSAPPGEGDVERLFTDFTPLQMEILNEHGALIDGVADLAARLRSRGVRLGGTTGYTRPMLDLLMARAAPQGYAPELSLCPDDVGGGRPLPWMCFRIALEFRLTSAAAAVKVGDTPSDIREGLNAGMWTIGISETGNEVGLTAAELAALPEAERFRRRAIAQNRLQEAGAHYVVETVARIEPAIEDITRRLAAGERP